jgi:hypothetical protein
MQSNRDTIPSVHSHVSSSEVGKGYIDSDVLRASCDSNPCHANSSRPPRETTTNTTIVMDGVICIPPELISADGLVGVKAVEASSPLETSPDEHISTPDKAMDVVAPRDNAGVNQHDQPKEESDTVEVAAPDFVGQAGSAVWPPNPIMVTEPTPAAHPDQLDINNILVNVEGKLATAKLVAEFEKQSPELKEEGWNDDHASEECGPLDEEKDAENEEEGESELKQGKKNFDEGLNAAKTAFEFNQSESTIWSRSQSRSAVQELISSLGMISAQTLQILRLQVRMVKLFRLVEGLTWEH